MSVQRVPFSELAKLAEGGGMMVACGMHGVDYERWAFKCEEIVDNPGRFHGNLGAIWQRENNPQIGGLVCISHRDYVVLELDANQIMVASVEVVSVESEAA